MKSPLAIMNVAIWLSCAIVSSVAIWVTKNGLWAWLMLIAVFSHIDRYERKD